MHDVFLDDVHEREARSAHAQIKRARDGEHRVADGFGFDPARREAPDERGVGVGGQGVLSGCGILLKCA